MTRWLDPTILPPDATAVVERAAAYLKGFATGAPLLGGRPVNVWAHEEEDENRPIVVVREPVEADRPGQISERAARIEVMVEIDRQKGLAGYSSRRHLATLHRWALGHLVGFDAEAVTPLPHATTILPLTLWLPPSTPATDADRGTIYSIATLLATLGSRPPDAG